MHMLLSHTQVLAPAAAVVSPSIDPNAAAAMTGGPHLSGAQTGPASGAGQPQLGSNAGSMASGPNSGNNGGAAAGQPVTNMGAGGAGMGSGGMGNNTSGQGNDTGELPSHCPTWCTPLSKFSKCIASQPEKARLNFSASLILKMGMQGPRAEAAARRPQQQAAAIRPLTALGGSPQPGPMALMEAW